MSNFHWYSFAFHDVEGNTVHTANSYAGYATKGVNLARIATAKKAAKVTDKAVLTSVSYLGEMTAHQFKEGEE